MSNIITDGYEDVDAINPRRINGEPAWDVTKGGTIIATDVTQSDIQSGVQTMVGRGICSSNYVYFDTVRQVHVILYARSILE